MVDLARIGFICLWHGDAFSYLKLLVTLLLGVLSTAISWDNSVWLRFSYVVISLFEVHLCVCVLCFLLVS